jgi:rubrerythrin
MEDNMAIFDMDEVFRFAVRIEENGEKFYRHAAVITEDETARYMFNHLADEEIRHKNVFTDMASKMKVECKDRPESYPGEYIEYLHNYLDNNIVFNKKAESEFASIQDTMDAINFAIDRETDSILYYSEIKQLVPKSGHALVDEIIAEERKHFLRLAEFKKDYRMRNP